MRQLNLLLKLAGVAIRQPRQVLWNLNLRNLKKLRRAMARRSPDFVYELVVSALGAGMDAPLSPKAKAMEKSYPGITEPVGIPRAFALEQRLRPPAYEVREDTTKRVNICLPHLDPNIIFGGYIACLEFICKLVERGHSVRILLCETTHYEREKVLQRFEGNPAIRDALMQCEIENISYGEHAVVISPRDAFIAYSAWTAILAHALASAVGKKFIFFLQEHESIFHCNESERAIIDSVYDLPHYAMFNTALLRDYFKQHALGVFAPHQQDDAEHSSLFFQHALTKTSVPDKADMASRTKKRLLFYGRPENHARRNLFEIAYLGLRKAVANGVFAGEDWEFIGVGTLGREYTLPLGDEKILKLISKLPLGDYAEALKTFDLGLSLMYAPHPSILPFEMASAGIISITNTYGGRDEAILSGISKNIIPCKATVDSIAAALEEAVRHHIGDYDARLANASLDWVTDWNDAFNADVMGKVDAFIGE